MNFAALNRIVKHIGILRANMAGIVPPWYREHCEETIRQLELEKNQLCLDC